MKSLLSLLTLVLPLASLAGNGSGGVGPRPRPEMGLFSVNPEIVFNMGEAEGLVRFAHAKLVNNEWKVQKIEAFAADLSSHQAVTEALEESKANDDWAEIK